MAFAIKSAARKILAPNAPATPAAQQVQTRDRRGAGVAYSASGIARGDNEYAEVLGQTSRRGAAKRMLLG